MSNFGFLRAEWPALHDEAVHAERIAVADPRASCFYARRCLELTLQWLYDADEALEEPYRRELAARINEPTLVNLVGPAVRTKMDAIRRQGNAAVHRPRPINQDAAVQLVSELFHVLYWLARRYTRNAADLPESGLAFDRSAIPRPVPESVRRERQAELKAQEQRYAEQDAALATERKRNEDLDAQIAELQAEVKAAKAANAVRPDNHDYRESETRALIIDLLLNEAGWALDKDRDREYPVTGLPASVAPSGRGKIDYVLWDDDGAPLAVIEAKRTSRDAITGQQQGKLYADALEARFGQRPVIFCTNGNQTYLWDDTRYPPRQVQGFYTRDELRLLIQRRTSMLAPNELPIDQEIAGRYYQSRAIRRIAETFEERQREALLVMATGAGKTRTAIALVDLLSRANWVKRVLFLADRRALVTQATNEFKVQLPGTPVVNLLTEKDPNARVFVSTYPTMMGMVNEMTEAGTRRFGPGYFDLVIIDEAHRSIYQKYGALFDYFDSLLVGLTATPKDEVDRNTYRRFHLEDGVPTDVYGLDEAVADGYLVPPRTVDVPLKFQREGIRYADLSDADKQRWDDLEWDTDDGVPDEVTSEELNKFLFNADTVDKALKVLMLHGGKVAGGDQLGKTIVFAKNSRHANYIAERFDRNYPEFAGAYARVITHQSDYAQDLIEKFADRDTPPHIAISVDMLDTGIDIPEVVNLVFFKPVRSKTKFWQMMGRGTRLCRDLFGPNRDKHGFLVFDLCMNVEFFNQDLIPAEGNVAPSLSERLFRHRADLLLALDEHRPELHTDAAEAASRQQGAPDGTTSERGLRLDLARRLQQEVAGMNTDNFLVRPHREQVETYSKLSSWQRITVGQHAEAVDHLAALPTTFADDENSEEAKRFDLLALRLQLAALGAGPGYARLRDQVQDIASALLDQSATVPAIRAQAQLLDELTGDEWWQDVTLPMLETMRRNVRGLVKLVDKAKRGAVYTDFEDEVGDLALTELKTVGFGTDRNRFEAKVRTYLRTHEDHLAVQKIRRNRQITDADLNELERVFLDAGFGTEQDIEAATRQSGGFGLFLRSITGLERDAAVAAFDGFQAARTLTANQLDFVNLTIDVVARNGILGVEVLYEPPFSHIAPAGPEDLFTEPDVHAIESVLRSVHDSAVATDQPA